MLILFFHRAVHVVTLLLNFLENDNDTVIHNHSHDDLKSGEAVDGMFHIDFLYIYKFIT